MSNKETIINDGRWAGALARSKVDFQTTQQEQMLNKIRSLYVNEFNYWRHYECSNEVWKLDLTRYNGLNKRQVAGRIRNDLQQRLPDKSFAILKAWEYVCWLLDDTYIWYD